MYVKGYFGSPFFMYNGTMSDNKVKFVFNQTYYYGGEKYQSGDIIEIPEKEAQDWDKAYFGNIYKPKGSKKKKEK